MKARDFIFAIFLITMVGCSSSTDSIAVSTITQLPEVPATFVSTPMPTQTVILFPTSIPSITPTVPITPQLGFQIWDQVSISGVYAIQYPENQWRVESDRLVHTTLIKCMLEEHSGDDRCMSGGCPATTEIPLGDVVFNKMAFGNGGAIYTNVGPRFGLSFEVHSWNSDMRCIQEAEQVLGTLQIRPERGCVDRAAFVADVTIPDNTVIPAGTKFVKTWRLKNEGTCTWTKEYSLIVFGKSSGTEADWVAFDKIVPPQDIVDLSIELPTPAIQGTARWEGTIQNEVGDWFGIGIRPYTDMFGKPFWVQIIVGPPPSP
jgi:hypothetical protein